MIASNVMKKKVKFNPQKDDVYVYEKKDYVKCSRKSQTHSKGHNKLCRTTDEIRKDEQWAYSCRLAQSRGKAMAIILDEKYDYCDIDEVLIIVGPTLDIMIKMEHDDDMMMSHVKYSLRIMSNMLMGATGKGTTSCASRSQLRRETRGSLWTQGADTT